MTYIFHIINSSDWDLAQKKGVYSPKSLKIEGFIHCSQTDQIINVANSFYKGQEELLLLRIKQGQVRAEVKHEPPLEAPLSGLLFPHIYGDLNLDAVDKVFKFPSEQGGFFVLPIGLLDEPPC
jgi:uncharacterized protein (DUF952 family)